MLSDYDKLLVTGRNPIREKQGQVRKPVGRDLIVKMGAKRILVADTGEEFRRSFIETVASEPDIQVLGETGDGQELVQMVKEMAPDLVVMEIVLAQMDGIEVLEELGKLEHRPKVLILSSFPAVAMVFVYGGITWWDALSLIFCYVAVAFMAGSLGIFFSSVFRRSTVSTAVTYGTLIAFVAGTYFINRFALSMSAANLDQTIAVYAMEAPAIRASSGGAFYLFLMNPAFTFMAVIGNQAGRSTSFASVCSYFGMENTGFVMEHWVLLSVLLQLAAGALLLWEAVQFLEPVKKKGKRKNKRMRHTF